MKTKTFALITGASSGIGKSLATECARRNMNLALVALPGTGLLQVAVALEQEFGIRIYTWEGDLTDMDFCVAIHSGLTEKKISVSLLVNNAGMGYEGRFEDLSVEYCTTLMQLNMQSLVVLTRLFMEDLKQHQAAFVLNVSSLASFTPMPYKSMYAASKSFVYSFSLALRSELKDTSVSVSVLCPGAVPTNARTKASIRAHGFFARISSLHPQELAEIAIENLLRKKDVIIPGLCNKLSRFLLKFIPESLQLHLLHSTYAKNTVPLRNQIIQTQRP